MTLPRAGDERSQRDKALLLRPISVDVAASTGTDEIVPVLNAWTLLVVQSVVIIPEAAFAADGSNYWTIGLRRYRDDGTRDVNIPGLSFATDKNTLTVGRAIRLPVVGDLLEFLESGWSLYLSCVETGTAASLAFRALVNVTVGG